MNKEVSILGGREEVNGKPYMRDAKGSLTPLEMVKPVDKLEDDLVREVMHHAGALSDEIGRFRGHTMTDLGEFDALLEQEYGLKKGGKKGNRTYQTYDGCQKVTVQVSDFIDFGPQLQVAKEIVDECLNEWASDSRAEIRALIQNAFTTDKAGQINRSHIFMLLRLDIEDSRWQDGMRAIRDAMRVTGSKEYVRFYRRDKPTDGWQAVTIDLAKATKTKKD
jgi:hypothetical protein